MDWRPSAPRENLALRAGILERIRAFFAARGVLEVDTPALSRAATTDPQLHSFATRYAGPGAAGGTTLYLHTSPEFPMKRLLAAGSGPIYQICKVFRNNEAGRLHNPEFTLLEWYRLGMDHHTLMDEVETLVRAVLPLQLATERLSYRDAFLRWCGIDPHAATGAMLAARARALGIAPPASIEPDDASGWRDLLLTHAIEPHLGVDRLSFLYDFPASQAALARVRPGDPPLASRFELYMQGVELANGFHELTDANEQRRRVRADLSSRQRLGLPAVTPDERLLQALDHGLPECAGVALGIDRLVMLAAQAARLDAVISFPVDRA